MVPTLDPTQTQTLLGFRVQQANPRGYSFLCAQRREDEERRGAGAEPGRARRAKRRRARDRRARPSRGAREDGEQPSRSARGERSAGERGTGARARAAGRERTASSHSKRKVLSSGLDQLSRSDESQIPIRGRFRPLNRVDESKRAGVGFTCSIVSRASESRWHFSGREPDSAPGSLSPARPRRKQTRTAARSDRPTRTASPLKVPPGQKSASLPSEGGSPEREAGLRLKTASKKKAGPPSRGRFCSLDRVESKREPMAFVRARARFRSEIAFARSRRKQTRTGARSDRPTRRCVGKLGLPH